MSESHHSYPQGRRAAGSHGCTNKTTTDNNVVDIWLHLKKTTTENNVVDIWLHLKKTTTENNVVDIVTCNVYTQHVRVR